MENRTFIKPITIEEILFFIITPQIQQEQYKALLKCFFDHCFVLVPFVLRFLALPHAVCHIVFQYLYPV